MGGRPFDGYSYYIDDDSDEEDIRKNSSDEEELNEIDVFLRGTKEQQIKALKSLTGDEASSDEDDFEKMMQNELENKVKKITSSWKKPEKTKEIQETASSSKSSTFYDDIYFDSDEEQKTDASSRKRVLTNDELFYDPSADEEDQKWVDSHRKRIDENCNVAVNKSPKSKKSKGSDAVLNCPACMTTLCVDCQRHSIYHNQYRAMFVMNCDVKMDELLHYKPKKKREFKRHKKHNEDSASVVPNEGDGGAKNTYHPVNCSKCSTEVAVFDSDEIYHFFNILSSYS